MDFSINGSAANPLAGTNVAPRPDVLRQRGAQAGETARPQAAERAVTQTRQAGEQPGFKQSAPRGTYLNILV